MVNIGRVDFLVDFDGKKLPARARQIGNEIGNQLGEGTNKAFDKQMSGLANKMEKSLQEQGKLSGINFTNALEQAIRSRRASITGTLADLFSDRDAFNDFVGESERVGDGLERINALLQRAKDEGALTNAEWKSLTFTTANWGKSLEKAEAATDRYKGALDGLNDELRRTAENQSYVDEAFERHAVSRKRAMDELMIQLGDEADNVDRVNVAWEKHTRQIEHDNNVRARNNDLLKDQGSLWSGLSFNVRQAIAITAAIAAGGQQIASLGSALGGSLVTLAGQVSYAAGALIPLAAVLPNAAYGVGLVVSSLEDLTDKAGPVKDALDELKAAFDVDSDAFSAQWEEALGCFLDALADSIEGAGIGEAMGRAASEVTNAFTEVLNSTAWRDFLEEASTTLPNALSLFGQGFASVMQGVADVLAVAAPYAERIAAAFDEWAASWAGEISEMANNGELAEFFERALDAADGLLGILDNVKDALGNVFGASFDSGQRMLDVLDDLTSEFEEWTDSVEGNKALTEWFENSERIFEDLLDLLGETGAMFGRLVDDESIDRLSEFIDNLGGAMPFLEGILEVLGNLDPFGILAQLLNDVGNALVPVLDLLEPLGTILNTLVTSNLQLLSVALELITPLLAPFEVGLRLWAFAIEKIQEWMAPFMESLQGLGDPLNNIADRIYEGVLPAFDDMLTKILDLLPPPAEMARIIDEEVIPAIQGFADWIVETLVPALSDAYDWISDLVDKLGGWEGISAKMAAFLSGLEFWSTQFVNLFRGPVGWAENLLNLLAKLFGINATIKLGATTDGVSIKTTGKTFARGGFADEPSIFGEDGPELAVPLNRPLSDVDPSVRRLSAILQGKADGLTGGGDTSYSRVVEAGAIQIINPHDPDATAEAVLDRIVAEVGS